MICWIASYPKSGNTWIRSLISDYIFFSKTYSFENSIYQIKQFPSKKVFDFLFDEKILEEENKKKFINLDYASNYWQIAQERMLMQSKEDIFLKTHGVPCKINNNFFISAKTTRAAICIIRDPRQVALSMINHFNFNSHEKSFEQLNNDSLFACHFDNEGKKEVFSFTPCPSWDIFYYSWQKCQKKFPVFFIRYEDIFDFQNFYDLLEFLYKNINLSNIKPDKVKAKEVFDRSNIKNLKRIEAQTGFREKLSDNTESFFNEGETSSWKNRLEKDVINKIEQKFKNLMNEFNYL